MRDLIRSLPVRSAFGLPVYVGFPSRSILNFARNDKNVIVLHDTPFPLWVSRANVVGDIERRFFRACVCASGPYEPASAPEVAVPSPART